MALQRRGYHQVSFSYCTYADLAARILSIQTEMPVQNIGILHSGFVVVVSAHRAPLARQNGETIELTLEDVRNLSAKVFEHRLCPNDWHVPSVLACIVSVSQGGASDEFRMRNRDDELATLSAVFRQI